MILILAFGTLSVLAVRGIPLFSLFFIAIASQMVYRSIEELNFKTKQSVIKLIPVFGFTICILFTLVEGTYASCRKGYEGLGLISDINLTGEFLRKQQIPGRIFNNYDIGSYLIYHLHDKEKVFVDNRPEAYSVAFFDSIYKPMQQDDELWKQKSLDYGINIICFYRHDNTPWAQPFLIRRTQDPDWVPVFVDQACIILIRNTQKNQQWINKFGIDRRVFISVPN
jgi:amino acid transporter